MPAGRDAVYGWSRAGTTRDGAKPTNHAAECVRHPPAIWWKQRSDTRRADGSRSATWLLSVVM
jgi:hypothetical protein